MHFWLSTIGHYLVTRALNRALNGVFGGDARGTKSKIQRALLGHHAYRSAASSIEL